MSIFLLNGSWHATGSKAPDRNIPSQAPPPGVTTPGVWLLQNRVDGPSGSGKAIAVSWLWYPLPVGTIQPVAGTGGQVIPTVSLCAIASLSAVVSDTTNKRQQLQDGPWLTAWKTTETSPYLKILVPSPVPLNPPGSSLDSPPAAPPNGWSGGAWSRAGGHGIWVYLNGQSSSTSILVPVLAAAGVAAAGAGAYLLM